MGPSSLSPCGLMYTDELHAGFPKQHRLLISAEEIIDTCARGMQLQMPTPKVVRPFVRVRTAGRMTTDAALIHCQESRARCAPPTSATSTRRYWGTRHTFSTVPRQATQKRKWTMAQERAMAMVDRTVSTLRRQLRHHRTAAVPSCSSSSNLGRRRSSVSPSARPHTPWAVAWTVVPVPVRLPNVGASVDSRTATTAAATAATATATTTTTTTSGGTGGDGRMLIWERRRPALAPAAPHLGRTASSARRFGDDEHDDVHPAYIYVCRCRSGDGSRRGHYAVRTR
ncbi:hypothetical protein BJV77DRAFT_721063 [Russula vinacea]|nr:hypothetical protein BJV77DRAFT_721063 [Russula vinacea]